MPAFTIYSVTYPNSGTDAEPLSFRATIYKSAQRAQPFYETPLPDVPAVPSPERKVETPEGGRLENRDGDLVLVWEHDGKSYIAPPILALNWAEHGERGLKLLS